MEHFKIKTLTVCLQVLLISAILSLAGCGGQTPEDTHGQLETYKQEKSALEEKIKALESQIEKKEDPEAYLSGRAKPVIVEKVHPAPFSHFLEIQGEAYTDKNVLINPEAAGTVKKIMFNEGDWVEKGQSIMQIDDELIKRNIDEAETGLELSKSIYERQKNLWNRDIGSEVEFLRAKNEMERLEKNLATLQTQLRQTRVIAPISGFLDELHIQEGEYAVQSQPVARMINLDKMKIRGRVSEAYRQQVTGLDSALISFPSLNLSRKYPINHIGHMINPGDRTFRISVLVDNKDHRLKPNMLGTIRVRDYYNESVITVPVGVVRQEHQQRYVFVVAERDYPVVEKRRITTGRTYKGKTEVLEGLEKDEQLIIQGHNNVSEGDRVRLSE